MVGEPRLKVCRISRFMVSVARTSGLRMRAWQGPPTPGELSAESARLVMMIGRRAPSTRPAASAPARYISCLASILPASRSGTSRMSAWPATGETMPLVLAASMLMALSKASGPSSAARIWPRAAIVSAAASSVVWHPRIDGLHGGKDRNRGSGMPSKMQQVDRVLADVASFPRARRNVDGGVGNEERSRIAGHVHGVDVADAPFGPQPGIAVHDRLRAIHAFPGCLSSAPRPCPPRPWPRHARPPHGCVRTASMVTPSRLTCACSAAARILCFGADQHGIDAGPRRVPRWRP